jgi:putative colanic acid biosynthesis UDP-glucose lipid carrier transferase
MTSEPAVGAVQRHGPLLIRLAYMLDAAAIVSALHLLAPAGSHILGYPLLTGGLLMAVLFEVLAWLLHARRSLRIVRLRYELLELASILSIAFLIFTTPIALLAGLSGQFGAQVPLLVQWYFASLAGASLLRIGLRLSTRFARARGHDHRTAAFIGATDTARRMIEIFSAHRWMGIDVLGTFDDRLERQDERLSFRLSEVAGSVDHLYNLATLGLVDVIYVTLPMSAEDRIEQIIRRFGNTTVSIYYCPPLYRLNLLRSRFDDVFGQPVITVVETPFAGSTRLLKRLEDFALLVLLAPIVLPLMLAIAVAVKLSSPGPIFYRQLRYGLDGRPFSIWKFRSMRVCEDCNQFVQARRDDDRVTKVGAILRKTSLDELPQLLNVISGTMSVIGPRPHPVQLNEQFRGQVDRYMMRHKVKPGITGLAQVHGFRGETDTLEKMQRRVELDLAYMGQWSLGMDARILLRTLGVPFKSENAY